jgi:capsular polysaccharide export protein
MISQGLSAFRNKRILLLQGPVGPFFQRFAQDLKHAGAQVFKINLNGGDWLFYPRKAIAYRSDLDGWPSFLGDVIETHAIDTVMLFGDCRAYHRIAHEIAKERGLEVGVFEEGYIRPDYITLERDGVNGNSTLPDNPIFYLNKVPSGDIYTEPVGNTFWYAAIWVCLYYLAAQILYPVFLRYRHHRPLSILETGPWLRSLWRKVFYKVKEKDMEALLTGPLSRKFFLVPLQVHNDAQIHSHSNFSSVEEFVRRVVMSFGCHAPADSILVIKHHPMDRGYNDYTGLLNRLSKELGLEGRLLYVHDLHLPSLLHHARGTVLINSTVGLSALFHKSPLKVCGDAIYAMKGLVYQKGLNHFWADAEKTVVDYDLFNRFRRYLINHTQLNGSFYRRLPIPGAYAGIRWEERRRKPRKNRLNSARYSAEKPVPSTRGRQNKADYVPSSNYRGTRKAGSSKIKVQARKKLSSM